MNILQFIFAAIFIGFGIWLQEPYELAGLLICAVGLVISSLRFTNTAHTCFAFYNHDAAGNRVLVEICRSAHPVTQEDYHKEYLLWMSEFQQERLEAEKMYEGKKSPGMVVTPELSWETRRLAFKRKYGMVRMNVTELEALDFSSIVPIRFGTPIVEGRTMMDHLYFPPKPTVVPQRSVVARASNETDLNFAGVPDSLITTSSEITGHKCGDSHRPSTESQCENSYPSADSDNSSSSFE